ncbi:SPFH domain-containing protein [Pseudogracilibacillus auburnensis]|uniref:Regulator of protease activity HflC (Stomatin/prohibitin superfamily) n=1 Tax=Pseudogracilibacillus auburnensis TaxID=1494959 RepID=A0A2V3W644_9BACI|nr:SPFH domain-containing protein [Pseudogracilibacillus auburnensis]MBO1001480.1 SPFH domain-containing protein [Pseudogracilibacillus auburnensis]PXW89602.1 regulator of protease activity HflC (stomatin/prohibitin superfamily) [Pseudogracilibacillus auburnensis]
MTEKDAWSMNGYLGIIIIAILLGCAAFSLVYRQFSLGIICLLMAILLATGLTLIQPNQACVVLFFGKYIGSVRKEGLVITVPLSLRKKISLRVRNFHSSRLKVNDVNGNPIEIAAVIVFKVVDSAKAMFDVDQYEQFVEIQSETALRAVATKYPYDSFDEHELTLRGNAEEISNELKTEVHERLYVAGVEIIEARLTHLAYSTEIAQAMLQRQQASAIVAARKQIVEGAVGIVQDAMEQLEQDGVVKLNNEKRVTMMNNLLVSIVADNGAQPIINTGSLNDD